MDDRELSPVLVKWAEAREARWEELIGTEFSAKQWESEEKRKMREADAYLTNGEGEVPAISDAESQHYLHPGVYKWIRIYDRKSAIATFYIHTYGLETRLWLARSRKGMPPNPLDTVSLVAVENRGVWFEESLMEWVIADTGGESVKGIKPTMRVRGTVTKEFDHVWHFPGFKVRESKLEPVLFKLREAGMQRVQLPVLQRAIQLHTTGLGMP